MTERFWKLSEAEPLNLGSSWFVMVCRGSSSSGLSLTNDLNEWSPSVLVRSLDPWQVSSIVLWAQLGRCTTNHIAIHSMLYTYYMYIYIHVCIYLFRIQYHSKVYKYVKIDFDAGHPSCWGRWMRWTTFESLHLCGGWNTLHYSAANNFSRGQTTELPGREMGETLRDGW